MFETYRAYRSLKKRLEESSLCYWRIKKNKYCFGVTLSWPGEEEAIRKEIADTKQTTIDVANQYNLDALVEGPKLAAGGALVLYVGLR